MITIQMMGVMRRDFFSIQLLLVTMIEHNFCFPLVVIHALVIVISFWLIHKCSNIGDVPHRCWSKYLIKKVAMTFIDHVIWTTLYEIKAYSFDEYFLFDETLDSHVNDCHWRKFDIETKRIFIRFDYGILLWKCNNNKFRPLWIQKPNGSQILLLTEQDLTPTDKKKKIVNESNKIGIISKSKMLGRQ